MVKDRWFFEDGENRYRLLELVGEGGMARVYRAVKEGIEGFEKPVCIKEIKQDFIHQRDIIELFKAEARTMVKLQHANIVQVFDFLSPNFLNKDHSSRKPRRRYFMIMEFVQGQDLAHLLKKAWSKHPGFDVRLACFIVCEVLKALHFAHTWRDESGAPQNLVHCDISPQNILISDAGEVKLTDFGISRAQSTPPELMERNRGKFAYMSPEQTRNSESLDARSDIFSMGVVFYEMLVGRRLFKTKDRKQTIQRVRKAAVPKVHKINPRVPQELNDILHKALAKRREERFQSAQEMLDALSQLMVKLNFRETNHELATFMRSQAAINIQQVVVVSAQLVDKSSRYGSSRGARRSSWDQLMDRWQGKIEEAGGRIWERGNQSMLIVWLAEDDLEGLVSRALEWSQAAFRDAMKRGSQLALGLVPGQARFPVQQDRPDPGWELAGPFYLARWMMNLSSHRGRMLLTGVAHQIAGAHCHRVGHIAIQDQNFIEIYESLSDGQRAADSGPTSRP